MIRQTSLEAHHDTIITGQKRIEMQMLKELYQTYGPLTDREAALLLDWEKANVSARRNDLMQIAPIYYKGTKEAGPHKRRSNLYGYGTPREEDN